MKLTRDDVTIVNTAAPATSPRQTCWLIRVNGVHYLLSALDDENYRGVPVPVTVAFHASADGRIAPDADPDDDLFDATEVPALDHEACIAALLAYLNAEPKPDYAETPTPAPAAQVSRFIPPPLPVLDIKQEILHRAANDPNVDDDVFALIRRAVDGDPLDDE